ASSKNNDDMYNSRSNSWPVVKTALYSGLYPSVARMLKKKHCYSKQFGDGLISAGSVCAGVEHWPHRWIMYSSMVAFQGVRCASQISDLPPLALLLFGDFGGQPGPLNHTYPPAW